ncbi:MAG: SIMPL domain-containing protein [Sphingomonas sp.]
MALKSSAILTLGVVALLAGCGHPPRDPRGVDHDEVLLQVQASGTADAHPDEARFSAGVSSIGATATAATEANNARMNAVVAALGKLGVAKADIQTQQLTVSRIDWGANKNKFEANNVVSVRMRAVDKAGAAIAATTQAGANVLSGPDLRVSDAEAGSRTAYAAAFKAARARADTLADAAGLKVARILTIRDANGSGPPLLMAGNFQAEDKMANAAAPPPVMAGTNTTRATINVDFALGPKS